MSYHGGASGRTSYGSSSRSNHDSRDSHDSRGGATTYDRRGAPTSYADLDNDREISSSRYPSASSRAAGPAGRDYDRRPAGAGRDDYDRRSRRERDDDPSYRRRSRSPPPRRTMDDDRDPRRYPSHHHDEPSRRRDRSRSPLPSRSTHRRPSPPHRRGGDDSPLHPSDLATSRRSPPPPPRDRDRSRSVSAPLTSAADAAEIDSSEMARLMGFAGFDTTASKHVQDDLADVAIKKPRTHRQYMNRLGGFNRPLDRIK